MEQPRTNLDWIDSSFPHRLLETPHLAYSDTTIRRAFIVWLHCGHRNVFRDVCTYYHRLASLEDTLPADRRASSRHHEFYLFSNRPPTSIYLNNHFPNLYSQSHINSHHIKRIESIKNDQNVFNMEGFTDFTEDTGVTKQDIVLTSRMIRQYCKERQITLTKFLIDFQKYTEICQIERNVMNVKRFIRSKAIQAEIILEANFPTDFSFLHDDDIKEDKTNMLVNKGQTKSTYNKPLQNGNCKKSTTGVEVKSPKAKMSQTNDEEKENRNNDIINNCSVDYSDLIKAVNDNDKSSVADETPYPKANDDAAAMKILKRNGNHDISLKIKNSKFSDAHFGKIEGKMKSLRLS